MTPKDEFSSRLRSAMKDAGLEPSGIALKDAFNRHWKGSPVSSQAVWSWLNGKAMPRHEKALVLSKVLGVDPQLLLYGHEGSGKGAEGQASWEKRATYAERQTFEAFLSLPTDQRKVVREVILAFAKTHAKAKGR